VSSVYSQFAERQDIEKEFVRSKCTGVVKSKIGLGNPDGALSWRGLVDRTF
jgi:hypothetical protein